MKAPIKPIKPRNHVAIALMARGGNTWAHRKKEKACRARAKAQLRRGEFD